MSSTAAATLLDRIKNLACRPRNKERAVNPTLRAVKKAATCRNSSRKRFTSIHTLGRRSGCGFATADSHTDDSEDSNREGSSRNEARDSGTRHRHTDRRFTRRHDSRTSARLTVGLHGTGSGLERLGIQALCKPLYGAETH